MFFSDNKFIKELIMHQKKLINGLSLGLAILAVICLLIIVFQPTNVVVDEQYKTWYMNLFAWLGILLSAPIAYVMVKPIPDLELKRFGLIVHQTGVWGTRFCIVFLIYMLFAAGGYLIPKHIVVHTASEKFSEKVVYRDYRLSAVPVSPSYRSGAFYIHNEYLLFMRNNGGFLPLVINNWFGTNKLSFSQVENYLSTPGTRMQLNGRRHSRGFVYDSLTLN